MGNIELEVKMIAVAGAVMKYQGRLLDKET